MAFMQSTIDTLIYLNSNKLNFINKLSLNSYYKLDSSMCIHSQFFFLELSKKLYNYLKYKSYFFSKNISLNQFLDFAYPS